MAIPTFSTPANPTIGNGFDTEATILNTLLTDLKGNWSAWSTYLNSTGLEHQYIAPKAVEGPNINAHASLVNFPNAEVSITATSTYTGSTGSLTFSYSNAVVKVYVMLAARNDSGTDAFMENIIIERSTSPSFASVATIKINQSHVSDARVKVPQTNGEVTQCFFFVDNLAKSATTQYYRFRFTSAGSTIKVKSRASSMYLEAVNGIASSQ